MKFLKGEEEWSRVLFGGAKLGDARRSKRLARVAAAMAARPEASVSAACSRSEADAEGAHRLIRNKEISAEAIFESACHYTVELARQEVGDLLAVEDTTTLGYGHSVREELGDLGGKAGSKRRGWLVHTVMLLTEKGHYPLGPIEQQRWQRAPVERGKRHLRREISYQEKESFKWERASRAMEQRLGAEMMQRVISVCDREADVFEYLSYKLARGQRFVVRASWDRKLEPDSGHGHLCEAMEAAPVGGSCTLLVPQKGGRPKRVARLELRYRRVKLSLPRFRRSSAERALALWALWVKELDSSSGQGGLEWMLLTSEEVGSQEQALRVLGIYQARWQIEEWHKAWKTGCGVENRRQQFEANLEKVVVITGFVAVRLLQLRQLARQDGESSCERLMDDKEWRCLWLSVETKSLPENQPNMRWAYEALGRLGGWSNSKRDGVVGWLMLYRGWVILMQRIIGFELALSLLGSQRELQHDKEEM